MDGPTTSSPPPPNAAEARVSPTLFEDFVYHIASSFPHKRVEQLDSLFLEHGARKATGVHDPDLNLVIADGGRWEGWEVVEAREREVKIEEGEELTTAMVQRIEDGWTKKVEVVTDLWAERSYLYNKPQPPKYYSAYPSKVFSGVIACATGLSTTDLEVLLAGINALGGQWRTGLTKDVTHLFAVSREGVKYESAFHYQPITGIKVLLPHWFDDSILYGVSGLPTEPYEWPNPIILTKTEAPPSASRQLEPDADEVRRNMYSTAALLAPSMNNTSPPRAADIAHVCKYPIPSPDSNSYPPSGGTDHSHAPPQVWGGRKVVLSRTLKLYDHRRDAVQSTIERAGGSVIRFAGDNEEEEPEEEYTLLDELPSGEKKLEKAYRISKNERQRRRAEAEVIEECDVLITRWRFGRAYVKAVRKHKTIGTLPWVFHIQTTGIFTRPVDQLLHYPVPKRAIDGFEKHTITLTNYTGDAREYLKKLITVMGGTFTPTMSGTNTILIAAHTNGTKSAKAHAWSIPVVNHTWLEDCFIQWRNLTCALEKYIVFPVGIDFSAILGRRGVWVGLGGGNEWGTALTLGDVGSQEGKDTLAEALRMRDRLALEAEEVAAAGEDELSEDLDTEIQIEVEAEASEHADVEALLVASNPGNTSVPPPVFEMEVGGGGGFEVEKEQEGRRPGVEPMQIDYSMDVDDPHADNWDLSNLGEDPAVDEVVKSPSKSPVKATRKTGRVEVVVTPAKMAKQPTASSKPTPVSTAKPKTKSKPADSSQVLELTDSEDDNDEPPRAKKAASTPQSTTKTKSKPSEMKKSSATTSTLKKSTRAVSEASSLSEASVMEDEDVFEVEDEEVVVPKKGSKSRLRGRVVDTPSQTEEEKVIRVGPNGKSKAKGKENEKPTGRRQLPVSSDEGEEKMDVDDEEASQQATTTKSTSKAEAAATCSTMTPKPKSTVKSKVLPPSPLSGEEEDEEETVPATKSKSKPAPTTPAQPESKSKATSITAALPSSSAPPNASAGPSSATRAGLLNRAPKADARTRVRKKKVVEKEKVEVESEDEDKEAEEADDEVIVVKKSAAAAAKAKKAPARTQAKSKKRAATEESEEEYGAEKEAEDDEQPTRLKGKTASTTKAKPAPTKGKSKAAPPQYTSPVRKRPLQVYSTASELSSSEDDDATPPPLPEALTQLKAKELKKAAASKSATKAKPSTTTSAAKLKSKKKPVESETESPTEEEGDDGEEVIISKPRTAAKNTPQSKPAAKPTTTTTISPPKRIMSVLMPSLTLSPSKGKIATTAKPKGKARAEEEAEEDDEPVNASAKGRGRAAAANKPPPSPSTTKLTSKPKSKAAPPPKLKSKRPPTPSDEDEDKEATQNTEDEDEVNVLVSPRAGVIARTDSIRAAAGQGSVDGFSKSKVRGATTSKTTVAKPSPTPMEIDEPTPTPGPSSYPRRTAAVQASQRLHDTIMPDVRVFEAQMRKSTKARRSSGRVGVEAFTVKGADDDAYSLSTTGARKRGSTTDHEEEDTGKKKRRVSGVDREVEEGKKETKTRAKGKEKEKAVPMEVDEPSSSIVIMTTQVTLSDDVTKTLSKLGVKMTMKPHECTHLLARQVVRTEKFLCAIASASWILSEQWAVASAAAKRLLPEDEYMLKDKAGEKKYGINLSKTLSRAKEHGRQMLSGHTFYVTPKVPVDTKLLRSVVSACGGQLSTQTPSARIINAAPDIRHVISCTEDVSIWRPIAQQRIKIHTQELILTGVLKQEMEWDRDDFLVQM